jgi:uncharacterized RDD family membrane protein YckC
VVAYLLDLLLVLTLAMVLLPSWAFPNHAAAGWQLLVRLQQAHTRLTAEVVQALPPGDQAALLRLFRVTQLLCLAVHFFYFFVLEALSRGGSLGKRIVHLAIASDREARRATLWDLCLRTLVATLCSLIFFPVLALNFLWALFRRDRRCWHDIWSGTRVVWRAG